MSDIKQVLDLVTRQTSSDNNIRTAAELQFQQLVSSNPTDASFALMKLTLDEDHLAVDVRQSCLLHLRRLVPKYWSGAFGSFIGPPVNQDLKQALRSNLLLLVTQSNESKIRKGAAYVIVQIAVADFPDEWPDLLTFLFNATSSDNNLMVIGSLTVLHDLFDDLITEEQFWDAGVGVQLINHIFQLLAKPELNSEAKSSALLLFQSIINTLNGHEAYVNEERKKLVKHYVGVSTDILHTILSHHSPRKDSFHLQEIYFEANIYKSLGMLLSVFAKKFPEDRKKALLKVTLQDFNFAVKLFYEVAISELQTNYHFITTTDLQEPKIVIVSLLQEIIQTLNYLQETMIISTSEPGFFNQFVKDISTVVQLTRDEIETYQLDINSFVTEVTGLSTTPTIRDAIGDFLSELNDTDATEISHNILQCLGFDSWLQQEGILYLLECIFMNTEATNVAKNISLVELMETFAKFVDHSNNDLLIARVFLLLPKFFEKFESRLNINDFAKIWFVKMIQFVVDDHNSEGFDIVKASTLISSTYYSNFMDLSTINNKQDVQMAFLKIVFSLLEDAEEDSLPVLLEAITSAIKIDYNEAAKVTIVDQITVIDLIFKISYKAPADVQLVMDAVDCLKLLLEGISYHDYTNAFQRSLPLVFNIIHPAVLKESIEYSPELDLALELLGILLESAPSEGIPEEIFNYCFPVLKNLLLKTSDDKILQTGGQVFNNLIQKGDQNLLQFLDSETKQTGLDVVLTIASKFLSPELSDSAALNSGTIIFSVIEKFSNVLGHEFSTKILEATARRLLISKVVVTTENLIMVFCKLVLNSPQEMIDFLYDCILPDPNSGQGKSALALILPIWFQSFEIIRGYEKIKQNTLAIAKIFILGDPRIESLIVDGDLIPYQGDKIITRSMHKEMPDKYTQISASLKIVKLLVGELSFQCQQPDAHEYLPTEEVQDAAGDDDGWEDMDDIGVPNFDKLQSYVDSDAEDEDYDGQQGNEDLKNMLIQFFKECTSKNLGNFRSIYEQLTEEEKKIITENVIFN